MLESLKAAGALASLMKNKGAMTEAADRMKRRIGELRSSGASGGGAVRVEASGRMEILSVTIAPALAASMVDPAGRAAAEKLIADAANEALRMAQMMAQKEMAREAEAMGLGDLPGIDKLLGG